MEEEIKASLIDKRKITTLTKVVVLLGLNLKPGDGDFVTPSQ